ncbi:MAG: fimbrillin family protein [Bacteroidales bacterium]
MLSFKHTGTVVLLSFVLASCTPQENPGPGPAVSTPVTLTGSADEPHTRTILSNGIQTHWVEGDRIGLFSPQGRTDDEDGTQACNIPYSALNSAKTSAFTGSMLWGEPSLSHTFYAYYPYNSTHEGDADDVPVSLPGVQMQARANHSSHLGGLDFMVAGPVTVTAPAHAGEVSPAVSLTFHHLFSLIEFHVSGSGRLTDIRLAARDPLTFTSGRIDLVQFPLAEADAMTLAGTGNDALLHLAEPADLSETAVRLYMMVLPGNHDNPVTIGVKTDGTWKEMEKAVPGDRFARGQKYMTAVDVDDPRFTEYSYVYLPDENFKDYCLDHFDTNGDGKISLAEAGAVTLLNVSALSIASLEGIQHFNHASRIIVAMNRLTYLDVGQNDALTILNCSNNQLTSLQLAGSPALTHLYCNDNQLTSLQLAGSPALTHLYCNDNHLTALDVSQNTSLQVLDCSGNPGLDTLFLAETHDPAEFNYDAHTVVVSS